MTRRYANLQKKLQELEFQLEQVLGLPAETTPCHELLSDEIRQKLLFLNNLLSAEIASNPSNPRHLDHMSLRLTQLATFFHDWDSSRRVSATDRFDTADGSTCSCTQSCLNDDGEAEADSEAVDEELVLPPLLDHVPETLPAPEPTVKLENDHKRNRWKYCRAMISGMVIGIIFTGFTVVNFSGCFDYYLENDVILSTPT